VKDEVRRLAARLQAEGYESEYLDRVRAHLSLEESQAVLEQEIHREMALALSRTTQRLDVAMLHLELAERALREDPATKDRYDAARREALSRQRDLMIHREALGITQHALLRQRYPIPER